MWLWYWSISRLNFKVRRMLLWTAGGMHWSISRLGLGFNLNVNMIIVSGDCDHYYTVQEWWPCWFSASNLSSNWQACWQLQQGSRKPVVYYILLLVLAHTRWDTMPKRSSHITLPDISRLMNTEWQQTPAGTALQIHVVINGRWSRDVPRRCRWLDVIGIFA
jgi:hypothetical protein